jgi:Phosphotransferase system cellobiose-specific component IIC
LDDQDAQRIARNGQSIVQRFAAERFCDLSFLFDKDIIQSDKYENSIQFHLYNATSALKKRGEFTWVSLAIYSFGISSVVFGINGPSVVNSVWSPIFFVLTQDNLKAFQSGRALPHIYTEQFIENFSTYGGGGSILSLLIVMLLFCRSQRIKELGKLTILPSIFGIGEPLIYGLPVVLNPIIAIPFVITPLVNVLLSGMSFTFHLVPYTNGVMLPWTTPPIISGWLTTGSIWGAVLQLIEIIIGIFIYYPFIKVLDRQYLTTEKN